MTCSICLEPLVSGTVSTNCGHNFHLTCIQEWTQVKPLCPMCRKKFPSGYVFTTFDGHDINHENLLSEEFQLDLIAHDPRNIQFITNPTEYVKIVAILACPSCIAFITSPSDRLVEIAIREDPMVLSCVGRPSTRIQLMAVKQLPISVSCIKRPNLRVQSAALKYNSFDMSIVQYIDRPKSVLLAQDGNCVGRIKYKVWITWLKSDWPLVP